MLEDLINWLERFEAKILESPDRDLAEKLISFGNLWEQEIGKLALKIGNQMIDKLPKPVIENWENDDTDFDINELKNIRKYLDAIKLEWHGFEQYILGKYDEAINAFNQAIALKPDFQDALNSRHLLQVKLGLCEE